MIRRSVTIYIDEKIIEEMKLVKKETGISVSNQIELKLKDYAIVKIKDENI